MVTSPSILPLLPSPISAPSQCSPALCRCSPSLVPVYPSAPGVPRPLQACLDASQRPQPYPSVSLCPYSTPTPSHWVPVSPFPSILIPLRPGVPIPPPQPLSHRVFMSPRPPNPIPACPGVPIPPPQPCPGVPIPSPQGVSVPPGPPSPVPPPLPAAMAQPSRAPAANPRPHAVRPRPLWTTSRGARPAGPPGPTGGATALPQLSARPRVTVSPR